MTTKRCIRIVSGMRQIQLTPQIRLPHQTLLMKIESKFDDVSSNEINLILTNIQQANEKTKQKKQNKNKTTKTFSTAMHIVR